jgi:hypothetical protein
MSQSWPHGVYDFSESSSAKQTEACLLVRNAISRGIMSTKATIEGKECFQLGINVVFYAHAESSKWLMSRMKK